MVEGVVVSGVVVADSVDGDSADLGAEMLPLPPLDPHAAPPIASAAAIIVKYTIRWDGDIPPTCITRQRSASL